MLHDYPSTDIRIPFSSELTLPPMIRMRQRFPADGLRHPEDILELQLRAFLSSVPDLSGKRIALTAGSRGIPHLAEMIRRIGVVLQSCGAKPFVVPAMGSHGGATAEGQAAHLAGYGITEDAIGFPICSSMETVSYGQIDELPLYCDKLAAEADGIIVFNKVRPHTMFHGTFESGLAKMMAVGLGKHKGATAFHSLGFHRFAEYLPKVEAAFLNTFPVLCGIGVLQNEMDEIFHVEVIPPQQLAAREPALLELARSRMARLPIDEVDLLILDEVGKNISGSGFDPNIFARDGDPLHSAHTSTRFQRMYVRTLTPESHHLGTGAFFADFASRRLVSSIDWSATWTNCVTCNLSAGRGIPIYLNSDREALQAALQTLSPKKPSDLKILWVKNSLELEEFLVSEKLYGILVENTGMEMESVGTFQSPEYDESDYLISAF